MQRKRNPYDEKRGSEDCKELCSGGNDCCCLTKPERSIYHVYHICADSNCSCHHKERYEGKKPSKEEELYVEVSRIGPLKFVYYLGIVGYRKPKPIPEPNGASKYYE